MVCYFRQIAFVLLGVSIIYSQNVLSQDSVPPPPPVLNSTDLLDQLDSGPQEQGPSFFTKVLKFLGLSPSPVKQAEKAYRTKDYDRALQKFMEGQLDYPESQELDHNIGNAQYKKKKYDEAIKSYERSLNGDKTEIIESAYYNMGNSYFRKGEFAIQSGDQNGIQHYRSAMANYKKTLEINPHNKDAKRNIEVVQVKIKELLQREEQKGQQGGGEQKPQPKPSEKAKEVLARAMQLVKQRKYNEAINLLEGIIQEDPTAISFQSHVKRIEDVLNILEGKPVSPPIQQDPRTQQQGLGVI